MIVPMASASVWPVSQVSFSLAPVFSAMMFITSLSSLISEPGIAVNIVNVLTPSDDSVEYENRIYKLSPFVGTFLPDDKRTPSNAYQGAKFFSFKGRILNDLRKELESAEDEEENTCSGQMYEPTSDNVE